MLNVDIDNQQNMDVTITYDEVAALLGTNILLLEPHTNFERIRVLRRHFEQALQHLPCPQSTQLGCKGLVMLQAMYILLTVNAFCFPINPGPMADYTCADPNNLTPLTHTEQASVDTTFAQRSITSSCSKTLKVFASMLSIQASRTP
jgi:hypothetical protein